MASLLYHDVAPSGEDFTSLDAAIDHLVASHANFVTADVYGEVEIKGDWSGGADTTQVVTTGLTTDATHYLRIYTDEDNRATASGWKTDRYCLSVAEVDALSISGILFIYIDGLQAEAVNPTGTGYSVLTGGSIGTVSNYTEISNCRFRSAVPSLSTTSILTFSDGDRTYTIFNCILEVHPDNAGTPDGMYLGATAANAGLEKVYNCLVYGIRRGIRDANTSKVCVHDSVSFNNADDFYGTFYTIDYCASDDNDGTNNVAESGGGAAWPSDFTAAGSGDFTLLATSNLVGAGGMAGSGTFSDDIEGTVRGVAWDLGPYEWVSSGYSLVCDGGSYALTGSDAGALKGSKVAADAGSYALTGQDVGAYYGRAIDADAGAYTLTGQDIAALFGRTLAADAGSYTVTGSDVTLIYTPGGGAYVITAEGGVYAVTGGDAGLLRGYEVAADGGAYIVTGQDAATLLGRLLDAGAGTYALTGADAALLRAAKIAIDAGAYAVTGANAQLSYSVTVISPNVILIKPVERIKLLRPVERTKTLRPVKRGPIDSEPGQDGQGWDAGDGFVRSPIDDDAGTFRDRNIAPWGDDAGGDFVRHPPDTDAGTFASRSPVDDDAGGF